MVSYVGRQFNAIAISSLVASLPPAPVDIKFPSEVTPLSISGLTVDDRIDTKSERRLQ